MQENNRLGNYYNLLKHIFGKTDVEFLTTKIEKTQSLSLKEYSENIEEFIRHRRDISEVCSDCTNWFKERDLTIGRRTFFNNRIMEFPSWDPHTPLLFKGQSSAKKIMVLGIDPGPKIRTDLHTAYELGMHKINSDGSYNVDLIIDVIKRLKGKIEGIESLNDQVDNTAKTPYFKYLMLLFNNDLPFILKNIYNTDTCKCLDEKGNQNVMNHCFSTYLINEIAVIKPKVIIIQGNESYKALEYLNENFENFTLKNNTVHENYYISENFPKYGRIQLNNLNENGIRFIKIYHTSIGNPAPWHDNEKVFRYQALFRDKIWPDLGFNP